MPPGKTRVWWVCSEGYKWKAAIYSCNDGRGSLYWPVKLHSWTHNLKCIFPHIAAEWHDRNDQLLEEFTRFARNRVWWKQERPDECSTRIVQRTAPETGCQKCSNQSSKNEKRILAGLQAFRQSVSRFNSDGWGVNFFLPDQNIAVENNGQEAKD